MSKANRRDIIKAAASMDEDAFSNGVPQLDGPGPYEGLSQQDKPLALAINIIALNGCDDDGGEGWTQVDQFILHTDEQGFFSLQEEI